MARERDAERSKQALLDAAEQEFSEKGFFGTRIDEIANRANINKRMIYVYFGDKQKLYEEVLACVYSRMEQVEVNILEKQLEGRDLIRQLISEYFNFLHNNPTFVNILMWENLNKARHLKEISHNQIERKTIRYLVQVVEKGKQSGIFRQDIDAWQSVVSLITTCFANFSNHYTLSILFAADLGSDEMIEQRKKHTTEIMLAYLCGTEKEK